MFVMQDKSKKQPDPSVVPHELAKFDDKSLETAALHAVSYSDQYNLDMILYCSFEDGYKKKDEFSITFGCRDGYGNTLHQLYRFNRKKKKVESKGFLPNHNKWVPPTGKHERYRDPILSKVGALYCMIMAEKEHLDLH